MLVMGRNSGVKNKEEKKSMIPVVAYSISGWHSPCIDYFKKGEKFRVKALNIAPL